MQLTVTRGNSTMTFESGDTKKVSLQDMLCDLEKAIIINALSEHGNVKARASDYLSLNRTTLVEKCRKYGLALNVRYAPKKTRHDR
jgi:DNA-binding NtrC family response regulator